MQKESQLVRRCKWCVSRVGSVSYFVLDLWRIDFDGSLLALAFPDCCVEFDIQFTDGICPACFQAEISKISSLISTGHNVPALG